MRLSYLASSILAAAIISASSLGSVTIRPTPSTSPSTAPSSTPAAAPSASRDLPTIAEINGLMEKKQFSESLSRLRRLLDLKGDAANQYDRHKLQMLRTECLLQMKDQEQALKTLGTAKGEVKNQSEMDETLAYIAIIQRSLPKYQFTPKVERAKPLDILDKAQREEAFKAMWTEVRDKVALLGTQDKQYVNFAELMSDIEAMSLVHAMEFMATGKTTTTDTAGAVLHDKVLRRIDRELKDMNDAVDSAVRRANEVVIDEIKVGTRTEQRARKVGLSSADRQSLDNVQAAAKPFPAAMAKLSQYFVSDAGRFAAYADQASAISNRAVKALFAVY